MSSENDPAFPEVKSISGDYLSDPVHSVWSVGGLTKRELFAAMAMQGFVQNPGYLQKLRGAMSNEDLGMALAGISVDMADELIKELKCPIK